MCGLNVANSPKVQTHGIKAGWPHGSKALTPDISSPVTSLSRRFVLNMGNDVRTWTPPYLQAICLWRTRHDCVRISGLLGWHTLMPGHNGLFARQLPIALSYFAYLDILGFS